MALPAERRPTLIDALVLIAATAFGLAFWKMSRGYAHTAPFDGSIWSCFFHGFLGAIPVLAMWSVAVFALHFRRPRPSLRSLCRRPGFVVNAAVLIGLADGLVKGTANALSSSPFASDAVLHSVGAVMPSEVGLVVVGALAALALVGRWRPRPIWIDRAGWWLGLAWVGILLLSWSRSYLAALLL